jgi:hypothetical protein
MEKKLTDEELKQLTEEEFFEYLDKMTRFLKQHTQPLSPYHVKKYHTVTNEIDRPNTEIDYQRMKEIITDLTKKK